MTRENFKLEQQITRHIAGFETIGSGENLAVLGRNSAMRALLANAPEVTKKDSIFRRYLPTFVTLSSRLY